MIAIGIKARVVAKIGNSWYHGIVRKEKFHRMQQITSIDEVKDVKKYLTLKQYLKLQGRSDTLKYGILSKLGVDRLYILPKSFDKLSIEAINTIGAASVCDHCALGCKANTIVYKCNKFVAG